MKPGLARYQRKGRKKKRLSEEELSAEDLLSSVASDILVENMSEASM